MSLKSLNNYDLKFVCELLLVSLYPCRRLHSIPPTPPSLKQHMPNPLPKMTQTPNHLLSNIFTHSPHTCTQTSTSTTNHPNNHAYSRSTTYTPQFNPRHPHIFPAPGIIGHHSQHKTTTHLWKRPQTLKITSN